MAGISFGGGGGTPGAPGPPGPSDNFEGSFFFSDTPSKNLKTYNNGDEQRIVYVTVTAAFDGGATFQLGFDGDPGALIGSSEVDLTKTNFPYQFSVFRKSTATEDLKVFLAGTPTVGTAIIRIEE